MMKSLKKLIQKRLIAVGPTDGGSKFIRNLGFTMIELLIVIAILGILAVAVLSAINPIEQINRGRDTGSRSDAEQLLTAMDRFNAFQGFYPWTTSPIGVFTLPPTRVNMAWTVVINGVACPILDRLGSQVPVAAGCLNTNELNLSFIQRIDHADYNPLWVYNNGVAGASTYVCFEPTSNAFRQEAAGRCGVAAAGLPADILDPVRNQICANAIDNFNGAAVAMICLP